jgi:hypothetical protein
MRQGQHVADSSYLPWNKLKHSLSRQSLRLSMPCWEGKPYGRNVLAEIFMKQGFHSKKIVACCHHADKVYDLPLVLTWFQHRHRAHRFWLQFSFSSYLVSPASVLA